MPSPPGCDDISIALTLCGSVKVIVTVGKSPPDAIEPTKLTNWLSEKLDIENFEVFTKDIGVISMVSENRTFKTPVERLIAAETKVGIITSGSSCITTDAPAIFGFKATSVT